MPHLNISPRRRTSSDAGAAAITAACGVAAALTLCGCVTANPAADPPGPPAAWVQLNAPVSAAPVEYERRIPPRTPMRDPSSSSPPLELLPSETVAPDAHAPAATPLPAPAPTPPLAPAAELPVFPETTSTVPPSGNALAAPAFDASPARTAEPALQQSMLDELSSQLAALDHRMNQQAASMEQAQRQAAAAQQATMRLQTEFINWRAELDVVRDTIRTQSAADVQALDELNQTLEHLLTNPPQPQHSPGDGDVPHTARGRRSYGGSR